MMQPKQTAVESACGEGDSLCSEAIAQNYTTVLRSDACAIKTENNFNSDMEDYILWVPKYRRKTCDGNAYLNCSADSERFGPKQVTQESFLQGRGQVVDNPNCTAGGVKYLPQSIFTQEDRPKQVDMSLFSQPTLVPRSCGTLTEVDLQQRTIPIPGAWQGSYSPLLAVNFENDTDRSFKRSMKSPKTTSLGNTNKYPEWSDLKAQSEPYEA